MIIDKDQNITIVTQEKLPVTELVKNLQDNYHKIKNDNVIVNLSALIKISSEDILEFLLISNEHRSANHSFVIVSNEMDFTDMPDEIIVVPTLKEAYDIIEMEEIERDLGI